ncbi:MAG: NADH:ubiquinone oxidoreductase [Desulfobacterales bacterium]|nr:NADH:ubiquinone oxidoreductase [Desulfobacterales bacterium]MBF0398524.1 NADH:ubiquinone oxidoreductase [Desulfobacterales bacterium]
MSKTLYWIQCGACGGDSMGLLSMESPDILELVKLLDIEILWHPSLSNGSPSIHRNLIEDMLSGKQPLDILCVEGSIIRGPGGTGMYDTLEGKPKKDIVGGLVKKAKVVVAVGTCSSFGGIGSDGEIEATGLQFLKKNRGGFLGAFFKTNIGLPVINLPGCPCHPDVLSGTLAALCKEIPIQLNEYNSPVEWYNLFIHQGCVRNEYHEYRVEDNDFGNRGCLFFHLGCRGPLSHGPCNKLLWNRRSSKTRIGVPCFGCTSPDFPQIYPFFKTRNIAGIPIELPEGIDRAHYLAYKGMAAAAAPERLKKRETRV